MNLDAWIKKYKNIVVEGLLGLENSLTKRLRINISSQRFLRMQEKTLF